MVKRVGVGAALALTAFLAVPGSALAQGGAVEALKGELDITWVMVAAVLVLFMQAGFLLLEIGFPGSAVTLASSTGLWESCEREVNSLM